MSDVVHLPPEVCGCLALAQRHLDIARHRGSLSLRGGGGRVRKQKHEAKAQKLIFRAVCLMARRGEPAPWLPR